MVAALIPFIDLQAQIFGGELVPHGDSAADHVGPVALDTTWIASRWDWAFGSPSSMSSSA